MKRLAKLALMQLFVKEGGGTYKYSSTIVDPRYVTARLDLRTRCAPHRERRRRAMFDSLVPTVYPKNCSRAAAVTSSTLADLWLLICCMGRRPSPNARSLGYSPIFTAREVLTHAKDH